MFFKKISFAFIFLLFAYGQLQAQVLTIKDFTSLKSDLEKRIKANETQPGKTFRNLNNVNSKFSKGHTLWQKTCIQCNSVSLFEIPGITISQVPVQ